MALSLNDLQTFLQTKKLAVISTISPKGNPEAALIGIAVSDNLEIVFDTLSSTRKFANIKRNPNVAFVIGLDGEATVQYDGKVMQLTENELKEYREIYFKVYPDGKDRMLWKGITHFVVRPHWIRYSDYSSGEASIEEFSF